VAAPATAVAAIAAAARRGILVKNTAVLARLASCDSIICDKTATLTGGQLTVLPADAGQLTPAARRMASALGRASSPPVAQACATLDPAQAPAAISAVRDVSGQGIGGVVDRQMGRWADGQMGRWADGQMGRWAEVAARPVIADGQLATDDAGVP